MALDAKVAFLGAGNMAGAIIGGLRAAGWAPGALWATDLREARLSELSAEHGIQVGSDNVEAVRWADVVVLATKPQAFGALLGEISAAVTAEHLVVSIAAGVPVAPLEARLLGRVVRVMPNTPALARAGTTAIVAGARATEADVALVQALFDSVGTSTVLSESLIDAATAVSGSGPAYVFLVAEALIDAGVLAGLPPDTAASLATATLAGASKLLVESGESPAALRKKVSSPGGTTVAAIAALEAADLRAAFARAVDAAAKRSKELSLEAERDLTD